MGPQRPRAEKTHPWAEMSIYQFRRVDLSVSCSVGKLVIGELNCRRVRLSASWSVGELDCRRVGLLASWFVGELSSYPLTLTLLGPCSI